MKFYKTNMPHFPAHLWPPDGMTLKLAHAYVPWQRFEKILPPEKGLQIGTIFPELYWPYP